MGGRLNDGAGHTFQPPCLGQRIRGADGRVQGNKGEREREGVGRVREEVFVVGMSRSLIGNDQTNTNSSRSRSMPASRRVFSPSIRSLLPPLLSAHPLVCAPIPSTLAGAQKVSTIPVPLSIRSPPPPFCTGCLTRPLRRPLPRRTPAFPRPLPFTQRGAQERDSKPPPPSHPPGYATLTPVYAPAPRAVLSWKRKAVPLQARVHVHPPHADTRERHVQGERENNGAACKGGARAGGSRTTRPHARGVHAQGGRVQ